MNMFDQFEQASQKSANNLVTNAEMCTSGYIQMSMEPELPIFTKTEKNFKPADRITHVAISNKYLVIAMANNVLFRMNLNQPTQKDEISLSPYANTHKLTNIFLDPYGNHLLLNLSPRSADNGVSELLYLSRKSKKLKSSSKFRGYELTAVAWDYTNESDNNTGINLLGTSKGLIFETVIAEGDKFFTSNFSSTIEQYWRQLPNYLPLYGNRDYESLAFDIGKGSDTPITGLHYFNVPATNKYVVFATTPNRLYFFTGIKLSHDDPFTLQQIVFNKYLNVPESNTFIDVPTGGTMSHIKFWSDNLIVPNAFTWMTENGIYHAQFEADTLEDIKTLKESMTLLSYPKQRYGDENVVKQPFNLVLSEFHILLAYSDAIKGISVLNGELVYEDNHNEAFGRLVNIVRDNISGTIWAVTEHSLQRFKVTNEERNVWQIYCDQKKFDLAKKYTRNEAYHNQVLIKEANMLFDNGDYEKSALRYAETQSSFEEICLKFIQVNRQDALKTFLTKKLENLKPSDKTQISMICIWLVELYLNEMEELRLANKAQTNNYLQLERDFESFLRTKPVAECLKKNKQTIYDLMASHGDKVNAIKLTWTHKDYEQLIRQHIYKSSFHEALEVLKQQNNRELFYQFAPILMQEMPKHVVKALIDQGANLSPVKILPALVSCDDDQFQCTEIIKYLEFCVGTLKCGEKAVHNLLVSLYAKYDADKLENYFNTQGQNILMINYDVYFALRLCQEKKLTKACVHLSSILGMWETAVDLALTISKDLAILIANQASQSDIELKKKLWLKIAKHVINDNDDIQAAMEFLQQCELIQIEDILPFFSDFVTIDHFKEAICNSLKEYNQRIEYLKEEMEEATKSAELVRNEIQTFRNKYTIINNKDNCEICELTLMMRPFYMFPCRHRFHSDCLLGELTPMLGPAKRNKLTNLQRQLNILNTQTIDNISTGSTGMSARDIVKSEIDNIVASECLYCGENMIRNIDMPFFEDYEYDNILKEWD